jgi:hypothetical protein
MKKTKIETKQEFSPTPTVQLTSKVGNKFLGVFIRAVESSVYADRYSYIFSALETTAPIQLKNQDTKEWEDVDIDKSDQVWVKGSTVLDAALKQIDEGTKIEIIYCGKGEAKAGQNPPHLFDVFKIED